MFSYVFRYEKCKENLFSSNLYAMHVEETLLPFSLLFSLKILLFSITTLPFWVASESHLLFLLLAKSLSSISTDSSSKKILDFVYGCLILIAPSVSNNSIEVKSSLNYKKTAQIFIFTFLLCSTWKSFVRVFTAFIKPYEAELWK